MFKLKPGNVFEKLNTMDRKKAYTIGAVVIVCFVALLTLASMMGEADDASFDGLNARGYDLAQMPFINDEAEKYLLAAKYPDMQENGSTLLYSAEEKEARQEADAEGEEGNENEEDGESSESESTMSSDEMDEAPTSRGYGGYNGGGRTATPTEVKQLGTASMQSAQGSGIQGSWGAPRGDFSPYKDQNKGSEIPAQLKKEDARKALWQTARGSRAAAGLKDGKAGNAKRAMMGGNIEGSEAFTDKGIDLSKANGLAIDTNAPQESGDLSNLDKKVDDTARHASQTQQDDKQTLGDKLLEQFLTGMVDLGMQSIGKLADRGIDALFAAGSAGSARRQAMDTAITDLMSCSDVSNATELQKQQMKDLGLDISGCTGSFAACVRSNNPSWAQGVEFQDAPTPVERPVEPERNMNIGSTDPQAMLAEVQRQQEYARKMEEYNQYQKKLKGYQEALEDQEDDLRDAIKDYAHRGGAKRNSTRFTLGFNDDGTRITESQVYHTNYYSQLGSGSGTHISYNSNRSNNTDVKLDCPTGQSKTVTVDANGNRTYSCK